MVRNIVQSPELKRGKSQQLLKMDQLRVLAYITGVNVIDIQVFLDALLQCVIEESLKGTHIIFGSLFEINAVHGKRVITDTYQLPKTLGYYATRLQQEALEYMQPRTRLYILRHYLELLEREVLEGTRVIIQDIATIKYRHATGIIGVAVSSSLTRKSKEQDAPVRVRLQTAFKGQTIRKGVETC